MRPRGVGAPPRPAMRVRRPVPQRNRDIEPLGFDQRPPRQIPGRWCDPRRTHVARRITTTDRAHRDKRVPRPYLGPRGCDDHRSASITSAVGATAIPLVSIAVRRVARSVVVIWFVVAVPDVITEWMVRCNQPFAALHLSNSPVVAVV